MAIFRVKDQQKQRQGDLKGHILWSCRQYPSVASSDSTQAQKSICTFKASPIILRASPDIWSTAMTCTFVFGTGVRAKWVRRLSMLETWPSFSIRTSLKAGPSYRTQWRSSLSPGGYAPCMRSRTCMESEVWFSATKSAMRRSLLPYCSHDSAETDQITDCALSAFSLA